MKEFPAQDIADMVLDLEKTELNDILVRTWTGVAQVFRLSRTLDNLCKETDDFEEQSQSPTSLSKITCNCRISSCIPKAVLAAKSALLLWTSALGIENGIVFNFAASTTWPEGLSISVFFSIIKSVKNKECEAEER